MWLSLCVKPHGFNGFKGFNDFSCKHQSAVRSRIGGGDADELLLSLLRTGASVRERESAAAALADAGSHDAVASAVAILEGAPDALHIGPEQAVRHARAQSAAPSRSTR